MSIRMKLKRGTFVLSDAMREDASLLVAECDVENFESNLETWNSRARVEMVTTVVFCHDAGC